MAFSHGFTFSSILLVGAILVGSSQAQAGFQWVPADQPAVASAPVYEAPPAPFIPATPAMPAPVKKSVNAPFDPMMLPVPDYSQDSGASLVTPSSPPIAAYEPVPMPAPMAAPVYNNDVKRSYSAPPRMVMPNDAPQSAKLKISSFPDEQNLTETQAEPIKFVAPDVYSEPMAPASGQFTQTLGFGRDVPLALALSQIVPPDFAYSFQTGVNPGYRVSWSGGKAWNEVIADMVLPFGYGLEIKGRTVLITTMKTGAVDLVAEDIVVASAEPVQVFDPSRVEPAAGTPNNAPIIQATRNENVAVKTGGFEPVSQDHAVGRLSVKDPGAIIQNSQPEPSLNKITRFIGNDFYTSSSQHNGQPSDLDQGATTWKASNGESLKETLARWSTQADVQLVWDTSYDHVLVSDVIIRGSFQTAVEDLLASAIQNDNKPSVEFSHGGQPHQTAQLFIKDNRV